MDYRRNSAEPPRRRPTRPEEHQERPRASAPRASGAPSRSSYSQPSRPTAPRRPAGTSGHSASAARRPAPAGRPQRPAQPRAAREPARRTPPPRRPARQQGFDRRLLIPILLVEVVLLILVISRCSSRNAPAALPTAAPATATPTPYVTKATTAEATRFVPAVTEVPTATPTPTAKPLAVGELLPIYGKVQTNEKIIAITVDDCFQMANLNKIIDYAVANNGKLTIFPAGRVLETDYAKQTLQRAYQLGFEIENHTYEHSRVYGVTDEEMAANIYKQNLAVNEALNLDYEMHFFRFFGGNGSKDPRVHQYLNKLGYIGVAYWSYSGSDATLRQIEKRLAPGAIFLFHTTEVDRQKLKQFIPYVASQGYKMVTLNELLGLESNRVSERTTSMDSAIPAPDPYEYTDYQQLKSDDKSYLVQLVQERLAELNYLASGDVDGDYGGKTVAAISNFQALCGLPVDGVASVETQKRLFADDAPYNNVYALPTAALKATAAPTEEEAAIF